MADKKLNERTVDVELEGSTIKVIVKKPSNKITSEAQRRGAVVWNTDGRLEKQLNLGKGRMKISKAKNLAIDMRRKRLELRDLLTERVSFESNTAESLSENTKFDYIVAHCTFNEDGSRVYNSLEDYEQLAEDPIAFVAAQNLAEMLFSMDADFEASLPENQFLRKFNFVNQEGSLVNKQGETIDPDGRLINDAGHYLDDDGNRIDKTGNPINEKGTYVLQTTFVDDDGKVVKNPDKPTDTKEVEQAVKEDTKNEADATDS